MKFHYGAPTSKWIGHILSTFNSEKTFIDAIYTRLDAVIGEFKRFVTRMNFGITQKMPAVRKFIS